MILSNDELRAILSALLDSKQVLEQVYGEESKNATLNSELFKKLLPFLDSENLELKEVVKDKG